MSEPTSDRLRLERDVARLEAEQLAADVLRLTAERDALRAEIRDLRLERDTEQAVALRLERECRNLRAEVARLREALEALLDNAETVYIGGHDVEAWTVQAMLNEDMRRARAVLAATERSER